MYAGTLSFVEVGKKSQMVTRLQLTNDLDEQTDKWADSAIMGPLFWTQKGENVRLLFFPHQIPTPACDISENEVIKRSATDTRIVYNWDVEVKSI